MAGRVVVSEGEEVLAFFLLRGDQAGAQLSLTLPAQPLGSKQGLEMPWLHFPLNDSNFPLILTSGRHYPAVDWRVVGSGISKAFSQAPLTVATWDAVLLILPSLCYSGDTLGLLPRPWHPAIK